VAYRFWAQVVEADPSPAKMAMAINLAANRLLVTGKEHNPIGPHWVNNENFAITILATPLDITIFTFVPLSIALHPDFKDR
jgi:hypothetical protein